MRGHARMVPILALLLCLNPSLRAQETAGTETQASRRARILEVARQIMTSARYCTLVTIGEAGQPQARVVDPLDPGTDFSVYVATNPVSRKVGEVRKDPRVTLLYFDPARSAYVTLIGRATEVTDAEKGKHRKKDWDAFFPAARPETYVLYRIQPTRLEVVSARDGLSGDPATWRPEIVELK